MSARLEVNLGALTHNFRFFASRTAAQVAGVVKADGYGLGVVAVAEALAQVGCRYFFVATLAEGLQLRQILPQASIAVFEGPQIADVEQFVQHELIPVISRPSQIDIWRPWRARACIVHADTGIHRLGLAALADAKSITGFEVSLLMTHLACADQPTHALNRIQLERFAPWRKEFVGVPTSIANSAGVLLGDEWHGDLVRPGIGLYGGSPLEGTRSPLAPVATLSAQVLQLREVAAGESVGYGATFVAQQPRRIAVVDAGYADGVPRIAGGRGQIWLHGQLCPIVGRISMDVLNVDITDLDVCEGDRVEILGEHVLVDDLAQWSDTISNEILTGLGASRCDVSYLTNTV